MSYDISLEVDSIPVTVKRHAEGGTFAIGGTDQAYLMRVLATVMEGLR